MRPGNLGAMGPEKLVNADGRGLSPSGVTTMRVQIPNLTTTQKFVVVERLSAPAILGCDFLTKHGLIIDFDKGTFSSRKSPTKEGKLSFGTSPPTCNLILDDDCPQAMPFKGSSQNELDMPKDCHPALSQVLKEHQMLFTTQLGRTKITEHVIDTADAPPVRVLPRPIPFHYKEQVHDQLQEMMKARIIQPSQSPWSAPAVYVP